jgi:hypothetical protein
MRKRALQVFGLGLVALVLMIGGGLLYLDFSQLAPPQELSRARDPSGRLDAIVVMLPADSLSVDPYFVVVKKAGKPVKGRSGFAGWDDKLIVFSTDQADHLAVRWLDEGTVLIEGRAVGVHTMPSTVTVGDGEGDRVVSIRTKIT